MDPDGSKCSKSKMKPSLVRKVKSLELMEVKI
jgi:hypothetical protein